MGTVSRTGTLPSSGESVTLSLTVPDFSSADTETVTGLISGPGANTTYDIDLFFFVNRARVGTLTEADLVATTDGLAYTFDVPLTSGGDFVEVLGTIVEDVESDGVSLRPGTTIFENVAPVIDDQSLFLDEGALDAGPVSASDQNGQDLTYSLIGGADAASFTIDPSTGVITAASAFDFEDPSDADLDGVHELVVAVSDGELTDEANVSVVIEDVDELPVIVSDPDFTVVEGEQFIGTVQAIDPEGGPVNYFFDPSTDSTGFEIDFATGALSFVNPPDFENPFDANRDNIYELVVVAEDFRGSLVPTQAITVEVEQGPQGPVGSLIDGLGGPAGFGENVLPANDDSSSVAIDISSVFGGPINFFGREFTTLFVNNNGNLTFDAALSQFTPSVITESTAPIIASFFADVDTRGNETGFFPTPGGTSQGTDLVYYDLDPIAGTFTATWDDVGFFSADLSKRNAFQIILTNQGGGDFDITFRYETIEWTTGNASQGTDGLGGIAARVGFASGDGQNAIELPVSGDEDALLALPAGGDNGDGVFTFEVRNGVIDTGETFVGEFAGVPVAVDDAYIVTAGATLTVPAAFGVLANDTDPDGDALTANRLQGPKNGSIVFNADGSFTYVPNPGFVGTDQIVYQADDGALPPVGPQPGVGLSDLGIVTIVVEAGDDVTPTAPAPGAAAEDPSQVRSAVPGNTLDGVSAGEAGPAQGPDVAGGVQRLFGTDQSERIFVEGLPARVAGREGDDTLFGAAGDDTLVGEAGDDALLGRDGADYLTGLAGNDLMAGDAGDDSLTGGAGDDWAWGGTGNDVIIGGTGNDTLNGAEDDDELFGDDGADILDGGSGNDTLIAGAGDDIVLPGAGDDVVALGAGRERLVLEGAFGNDVVYGFDAIEDTIALTTFGAAASVTVTDGPGGAIIAFGQSSLVVAGVAASALGEDVLILS